MPFIRKSANEEEPQIPDCDADIYEHGEHILTAHRQPGLMQDTQRWIMQAAYSSGQKIDWHYLAGHILIKAIGDLEAAKKAIIEGKPKDVTLWEPNPDYPIFLSDMKGNIVAEGKEK